MLLLPNNYAFTSAPLFRRFGKKIVSESGEKVMIWKFVLLSGCLVVLLFCWMQRVPLRQQNNQTTKQPDNKTTKQQDNKTTSIVWKTIPSEARVTRDEVSGYMIQTKTAVWKTVPCIGWIPMLLVQSSRQLSFSFYNPETYKTPSYLLAGWRLDTLFGLWLKPTVGM